MTILSSDYPRMCSDYPRIILESSFYWRKHSGSIRWNLELQDFVVGAVFGEVGGWLDWLRALEMTFHMWRRPLMTLILCGRCSIWWGWRVICVAGAIFGEVGGWLFVAGAALRDILGDSRSAKCCILQYKIVSKLGRVRSPKRRVRDDDFILGLSSDILGLWSNRLSIGGSTSGISAQILTFKISWQAQYLVRLEGDLTGSAHWKWRFKEVPEQYVVVLCSTE